MMSTPEIDNELDGLKAEARELGLTFSNNIGVEALRKRIEEARLEAAEDNDEKEPIIEGTAPVVESKPKTKPVEEMTPQEYRNHIRLEQTKLVRVRITCHNPQKSDLTGENITIGNSIIGNIRKHIPFGSATENGYHIPICIYNHLKSRTYVETKTVGKGANMRIVSRDVPEYTLTILPPLTEQELAELAQNQTIAETRS